MTAEIIKDLTKIKDTSKITSTKVLLGAKRMYVQFCSIAGLHYMKCNQKKN